MEKVNGLLKGLNQAQVEYDKSTALDAKLLAWAKRRLYTSRVGWGKSTASEAKVVSKNEAIKMMFSDDKNQNKVAEIISKAIGLNKPDNPTISPFDPKNGFYVVGFERLKKGLIVYLRGLNLAFSTFKFVEFLLRSVYDAHVNCEKKHFKIYCRNTPVGIGYMCGECDKHIKIKMGEFTDEKFKKHEQILLKFSAEGRMVKIILFAPSYVLEKIIPKLNEMENDYLKLRITSLRFFINIITKQSGYEVV